MKKRNKVAYSPLYRGLMIWREGEGCSSFYECNFDREADAGRQLAISARELDADIAPAGSLDTWPE